MDNIFNELSSIIEERLNIKYRYTPLNIHVRIKKELQYIKESGQILLLASIVKLADHAKEYQTPFILNGSASGSLVLYILELSICNPLPAHYFCSNCNYFEWTDNLEFGIDLPDKICPECGKELKKDGCDIPLEMIWPKGYIFMQFDFLTTPIFIEIAETILKNIYGTNKVCPMGDYLYNRYTDSKSDQLQQAGFYILTDEKTFEDYSENYRKLPNGRTCLYFNFQEYNMSVEHLYLNPSHELEELQWLSHATSLNPNSLPIYDGKALNLINNGRINDLPFISYPLIEEYRKMKGPITVKKLVKLTAAIGSSYNKGYCPYEYLINKAGDEKKYLFDREETFEILKRCGLDLKIASFVASEIRKGKVVNGVFEKKVFSKIPDRFRDFIPEWIQNMAENVMYLSPRSNAVTRVIIALQLAYYKAEYSWIYEIYQENNLARN